MTRTIRSRRAETSTRPLYARMLRLRHLAPSGLLCFVFLEGAVVLGILLALAELVSWWGVLVLPVTVALMVKFNDLVTGTFIQAQPAARSANARASVLRPATMPVAGPSPAPPHPAPQSPAGPQAAVDSAPGVWRTPAADRYGNGYSNAGFRLAPRFAGAPGDSGEPGFRPARVAGAPGDSAGVEGDPGFRLAARFAAAAGDSPGQEGEPRFRSAAGAPGDSAGVEGDAGFRSAAGFAGAAEYSPGLEVRPGFQSASRFAGSAADSVGVEGSGLRPAARFAGAAGDSAGMEGEPGFRPASRFSGPGDPAGPAGRPRNARNRNWPGRW